MARRKIRIKLTNEEYNILNDISRKTKTDCWFMLDTDKEGFDCVYDLENNRKVTLRFAVQQLNDAIISELLDISIEEINVYSLLLCKLNIKYNPFDKVWKQINKNNENLIVYHVGFNGNDETEVDALNAEEAIELAKVVAKESGVEFELDYVYSCGYAKN